MRKAGIYRETFHLTWAKNTGFQGRKVTKATFSASHARRAPMVMHLAHIP